MCRRLRCEDLIGYESTGMGRKQGFNHKTVASAQARRLGNFDPCNSSRVNQGCRVARFST